MCHSSLSITPTCPSTSTPPALPFWAQQPSQCPVPAHQPSQCLHPKHTNHSSAPILGTSATPALCPGAPTPTPTARSSLRGTTHEGTKRTQPDPQLSLTAGPSRTQRSSAGPAPEHGAPLGLPGTGRFPHLSVTHPGAAEPPSADGSTWGSGRGRGLRPFRPSVRPSPRPARPRGAGGCCHLAVRGSETMRSRSSAGWDGGGTRRERLMWKRSARRSRLGGCARGACGVGQGSLSPSG